MSDRHIPAAPEGGEALSHEALHALGIAHEIGRAHV